MKTQWDPAHVRDVVAAHMAGRDVDAIITFDADGISLHPNHRALYHGARLVRDTWTGINPPTVFALQTLSWRTKFTGPVASVLQRIAPHDLLVLAPLRAYFVALQAMRRHATQLVWFRYLYVLFSSYMHANRFFVAP